MKNRLVMKRFVYLALLSAMAITLSMFESMYIGPIIGLVRLGLANIVALLTIKILGTKEMIIVNTMRVIIANLLIGMIFGPAFWISSGGVILSSIVLILSDHFQSSLLYTSIMCAIAHSFGQILIVSFIYRQLGIAVLLPYLLLGSIATGVFTGFVSQIVLTRIKPLKQTSN